MKYTKQQVSGGVMGLALWEKTGNIGRGWREGWETGKEWYMIWYTEDKGQKCAGKDKNVLIKTKEKVARLNETILSARKYVAWYFKTFSKVFWIHIHWCQLGIPLKGKRFSHSLSLGNSLPSLSCSKIDRMHKAIVNFSIMH